MGLTYKQGTFALNTATGNQVVDTTSGVDIKALILWGTKQTAEGFNVGCSAFFSLIQSSTARKCMTWAADDGLASSNASLGINDEAIRIYTDGTPTTSCIADFVSFGTGGSAGQFTINITTAPASAWKVYYLALGGTDLTNVFVGSFASATATGNRDDIGVGFVGDSLISFGTNKTAIPTNSANLSGSIGAAVSSTERGAIRWGMRDAMTASEVHFRSTAKCVLIGTANGNGALSEADFVAFITNGYTLNWTLAGATSAQYAVMVLKGLKTSIASILCPAATGTQSFTTGFNMAGGGVLFYGTGKTTADATQGSDMYTAIGAMGEASLKESLIWCGEDTVLSATLTQADMRNVTTKCVGGATSDAGPTVEDEADSSALGSTSYTISWTTVLTNAHFFGLAFAAAPAAGPGLPPPAWLSVPQLDPLLRM